ncbi:MAG: sugar nucleotide-binding protein [Kangiellaceae bacterium]|nr:sugar nucleotide-binding protein [Kangiellaceae bacterium]
MNINSRIVICGKGRIGLPLVQELFAKGLKPEFARIDPDSGLIGIELNKPIDKLVICISSAGKSWTWDSIFSGLKRQVENRAVAIKALIYVSSTRVYDGIENGFVDKSTTPVADSIRAQSLLNAEATIKSIAAVSYVIRPSGLYGADYQRYLSILHAAEEKPRFGTHQQALVDRLTELVLLKNLSNGAEILTDGMLYFKGAKLKCEKDTDDVFKLSQQFRVLLNSNFNHVK